MKKIGLVAMVMLILLFPMTCFASDYSIFDDDIKVTLDSSWGTVLLDGKGNESAIEQYGMSVSETKELMRQAGNVALVGLREDIELLVTHTEDNKDIVNYATLPEHTIDALKHGLTEARELSGETNLDCQEYANNEYVYLVFENAYNESQSQYTTSYSTVVNGRGYAFSFLKSTKFTDSELSMIKDVMNNVTLNIDKTLENNVSGEATNPQLAKVFFPKFLKNAIILLIIVVIGVIVGLFRKKKVSQKNDTIIEYDNNDSKFNETILYCPDEKLNNEVSESYSFDDNQPVEPDVVNEKPVFNEFKDEKETVYGIKSLFANSFDLEIDGDMYHVDREGMSFGNEKILFSNMKDIRLDEETPSIAFVYFGRKIAFSFNKEQIDLVKDFFIGEFVESNSLVLTKPKISNAEKISKINRDKSFKDISIKAILIIFIIGVIIVACIGVATIFSSSSLEEHSISELKYSLPAELTLQDDVHENEYEYVDYQWYSSDKYDVEVSSQKVARIDLSFSSCITDMYGDEEGDYTYFNVGKCSGRYGTYNKSNCKAKAIINVLHNGLLYEFMIYPENGMISNKDLKRIAESMSFSSGLIRFESYKYEDISLELPAYYQEEKDGDGKHLFAYGEATKEILISSEKSNSNPEAVATEMYNSLNMQNTSVVDLEFGKAYLMTGTNKNGLAGGIIIFKYNGSIYAIYEWFRNVSISDLEILANSVVTK